MCSTVKKVNDAIYSLLYPPFIILYFIVHDHDHSLEADHSNHTHAGEVPEVHAGEVSEVHAEEASDHSNHTHAGEVPEVHAGEVSEVHAEEASGHAHSHASCEADPTAEYFMPMRVGALFIILATSAVGKLKNGCLSFFFSLTPTEPRYPGSHHSSPHSSSSKRLCKRLDSDCW